jgi:hypothetical protein
MPHAAPLLPPSLLTPHAARLASSSVAPHRIGTMHWHAPCPAHHPNAGIWTKFPPLVCPSRCPLLPSLRSAPRERTLALPPH